MSRLLGLFMLEPVVLALILSVVYLFSAQISVKMEKYHNDLLSLSSGIFVAFLFLNLMPKVSSVSNGFFLLLIGFVAFHLAEKYVYQHKEKDEIKKKEIGMLDALGFFLNNFIDGIVLVFAFSISAATGYLMFLPLLLHKVSSSLALVHLIGKFKNRLVEPALASSVFLGALVAFLVSIPNDTVLSFFSFFVGTLIYLVVRDMIPKGKAGNPLMFVGGVSVSIAFYMMFGVV